MRPRNTRSRTRSGRARMLSSAAGWGPPCPPPGPIPPLFASTRIADTADDTRVMPRIVAPATTRRPVSDATATPSTA